MTPARQEVPEHRPDAEPQPDETERRALLHVRCWALEHKLLVEREPSLQSSPSGAGFGDPTKSPDLVRREPFGQMDGHLNVPRRRLGVVCDIDA